MPYVTVEEHIDIKDILPDCSPREIEVVIDYLVAAGHLPRLEEEFPVRSISEQVFEDALSKLHGKWNMLTSDEEDLILRISTRF